MLIGGPLEASLAERHVMLLVLSEQLEIPALTAVQSTVVAILNRTKDAGISWPNARPR